MKHLLVEFLGFVILSGIFWGVVTGDDVHYYDFVLREANFTRLCSTKAMLVVNNSFPGPVIRVHKGDTLYVNVYNQGIFGVTIHWRPLGAWEEELHYDLLGRLQQAHRNINPVKDLLVWSPLSSGIFSVKSLYDLFENSLQLSLFPVMKLWKSVAPPKIKAFGWLVWWGRIATANLLLSRQIIHIPIICALCGNEEESTVHLLIHCYYSWRIWSEIVNWWGIMWVTPGSIQELLVWWFGQKRKHLGRLIWEALPLAILWTIWIARNEKMFNSKEPIWVDLVENIKIKIVFWVKQSINLSEVSLYDFLFCLHGIKGFRARISD